MLVDLFDNFNPREGEIYWTHSLKCIPKRNDSIGGEWRRAGGFCHRYFQEELRLILESQRQRPGLIHKPLAVVGIGRYALTLCEHLLGEASLGSVIGIKKYIRGLPPEGKRLGHEGEKYVCSPFSTPHTRRSGSRSGGNQQRYPREGERVRYRDWKFERLIAPRPP